MFYLIDWAETFAPSALALFNGGVFNFYNPPWVLFPLIPFVLLPESIGTLTFYTVSLSALIFVAYHFNLSRFRILIFMSSYFVLFGTLCGNVEWLALLGLAANPLIGIPLLLIKPQLTIGAVVFIVAEMMHQNKWKCLAQIGVVTGGLIALSFWVDPVWLTRTFSYNRFAGTEGNFSLFPTSVPFGIALLLTALRTRQIGFALMSSPMFFVAVTPGCWMVVLLGLAVLSPTVWVASLGIWFYIVRVRFA